MIIDSHCHLTYEPMSSSLDDTIKRANNDGVKYLLTISTEDKSFKNILTVIIPRHIDRVSKIKKELSNLKLNVVLHSSFEKINEDTDILLIDAYGETKKFFQISKCVFLGKSLIKALEKDSGQNPIEPARLGCKIYHGPFISNFIEVYKYLNSLNVSKKVLNSDELGQSIVEEFINNGEKNQRVITEIENYGQNTLNNVLKEIKIYINNEK